MSKTRRAKKTKDAPRRVLEEIQDEPVEVQEMNAELKDLLDRKVFLMDLMEVLTANNFPIDSTISVQLEQTNARIADLETI